MMIKRQAFFGFFKSNKKADLKILNAITASTTKPGGESTKLIAQQHQ